MYILFKLNKVKLLGTYTNSRVKQFVKRDRYFYTPNDDFEKRHNLEVFSKADNVKMIKGQQPLPLESKNNTDIVIPVS